MESPISIRDTEIPLQMQNIIDASAASYIKSLHSLRATAQETARCQDLRVLTPNPNPVHSTTFVLLAHSLTHHLSFSPVQLDEVKAKLRETEDDFVKALAVKTRKEAKRMALMDVVASAKARVEDLSARNLVVTTDEHEESAFNSASAPVLSMSSVRRDFLGKENEHQAEPTEGNKQFKKQNVHRRLKSSVLSPGSASSVCQSPRLKV
ncbi:Kinetochore protein SPC25 [Glycine soja]